MVVEHDVEVSAALLISYRLCPEPLCTHAHHTDGTNHQWLAHAERERIPTSVAATLGATKITAAARKSCDVMVAIPPGMPYQLLDRYLTTALSTALQMKWHLHWERLVHWHTY